MRIIKHDISIYLFVGLSKHRLFQVFYTVINQLKSDIIVSCLTSQTDLLVPAYHMKRDQVVNVFSTQRSVTFVARQWSDGKPVTLNGNGKYSVTIDFHKDSYVAFKLMYTKKGEHFHLFEFCAIKNYFFLNSILFDNEKAVSSKTNLYIKFKILT